MFRVEVSIAWTICVWPLLFLIMYARHIPVGEAFLWALITTVVLFATTGTHELGHIFAGRRVGVETRHMTLSGLGGVAHMSQGAPSPKAEIFISLAGPVTHLPWMAVFFPAIWIAESQGAYGTWLWALHVLAWLQLMLMVFNLLPFWPLDGGKVFRSALAFRMHPNKASIWTAQVGYAGAVVMGLVGLVGAFGGIPWLGLKHWGFLLVCIAIMSWFACRRLQMAARHMESPYDTTESWKKGGYVDPWEEGMEESNRMSRAEEKREKKLAKARRKEAEQRQHLQARIDFLLDRINEVGGIDNLSSAERRELKEASARIKKADADAR